MMLHSTQRLIEQTAIVLLFLGVLPASAQTSNEEFKLIATKTTQGDLFGHQVAVSGTTVIIGASFDSFAGHRSGSAYVFDSETGHQLYKLNPPNPRSSSYFGWSVAISGSTALIGAFRDFDVQNNNSKTGSAYLYDTTTGELLFKLRASDPDESDEFGFSVAISGTTAIIGAHNDDEGGEDSGAAYIFDTETGLQIAKLTASDAATGDRFGNSVGISGTIAIIGAIYDDDAGSNSGSAYLFNTETGQQIAKLVAIDAAEGDQFGRSVAISGNTVIVGANGADSVAGSAYLFDTTTGLQSTKLTASDRAPNDDFGVSVALSDTTAIVGAAFHDHKVVDTGAAYMFNIETGLQIRKLNASDAKAGDIFGYSVAISDTTTIVGAPYDDDAGSNSGSAYLFNTSIECIADLTADGMLDFFDVSAFLDAFGDEDPQADFTNDGLFDFFDVSSFLDAFGASCP